MFNIQKAVSRLEFAPKRSEISITEVAKGLGQFAPRPEKAVSFDALAATLKKAGYTLAEASATVQGVVERENAGRESSAWFLRVPESKQRFTLRGFANLKEGGRATLKGRWKTENGIEILEGGA